MRLKDVMRTVALIAIMAVMSMAFTACGGNDENEDNDNGTGKTTQEETTDPTVGTDIDGRNIDDQSFYGTWIADSAKARNMFDSFSITFHEDGTYKALVTEEEITGTWTREGEEVTLSDTEDILPCNYTYTAKGGLKMDYEGVHIAFHR